MITHAGGGLGRRGGSTGGARWLRPAQGICHMAFGLRPGARLKGRESREMARGGLDPGGPEPDQPQRRGCLALPAGDVAETRCPKGTRILLSELIYREMSVYTFSPMRAALPRVTMPACRPQQRLTASLPSFTGMRMAKMMPAQLEGALRERPCNSYYADGCPRWAGIVSAKHLHCSSLHI